MSDMDVADLIGMMNVKKPPFPKFLKWQNTIVGDVLPDMSVIFRTKAFNPAIRLIVGPETAPNWDTAQFQSFLQDRIPGKMRRDIDKILQKCGLSRYDVFALAAATRAINARDLFWLSVSEEEKFEDKLSDVFKSIFLGSKDLEGGSVNSPEGMNIKRYAANSGSYGILKSRLHPYSTDVESEVAVYRLSQLMHIKCCPAWIVEEKNERLCFSRFEYDFAQEFIVHISRLFPSGQQTDNLYTELVGNMPGLSADIGKMILLDFVTRQDDRHLSNMALKVKGSSVSFYPLYDNGRSLFFEDRPSIMEQALTDLEMGATSFGRVGTYYDAVREIARDMNLRDLADLSPTWKEINEAYEYAGLEGIKLEKSTEWTVKCLHFLKSLC